MDVWMVGGHFLLCTIIIIIIERTINSKFELLW
jgi:hypothetical protein